MADLGWSRHIEARERSEYLASLTVGKFRDEFGEARYYVIDFQGDMVSAAFDTPEAAFAEIEYRREQAAS